MAQKFRTVITNAEAPDANSAAAGSNDGSVSEPVARMPIRRMLGSTGFSVLLHLIVIVILGVILVAQKEVVPPIVSEVRFDDLAGDTNSTDWVELDAPLLPEADAAASELSAGVLAADAMLPAASEMELDMTSVVGELPGAESPGLPIGVAAVAKEIQKRVSRAGGQTGEVQFSLSWHSLNDVDLHVIAPSGEHISYAYRNSQCHGELDVDMNASGRGMPDNKTISEEPVENVRWRRGRAPAGRYTVIVHQYRRRNGNESDAYQLLGNLGRTVQVIDGEVSAAQTLSVHRFQYVSPAAGKGRQKQMLAQLSRLQQREDAEASAALEKALALSGGEQRDQALRNIVNNFPHTDAAIRAMRELGGMSKR